MIVSLNWLKKFTEINMPVSELATLIGARLVEIEKIIDLGVKYKDVLIVRAVEVNNLEGSDHLHIVKIDDSGVTQDIERDENGLIQVVCGAPNIATGQMVAWLPPRSIVPNTYYLNEQFMLDVRELRGVTSNGMIASARELDLFDEHEGILVLDDSLEPGASFAKVYELDDYLLDIENKSLTHRPDCFSIIGFAREVAAISGNAFKTPDWLINFTSDNIQKGNMKLDVAIDDTELSSRYQAVVMSGVDGKKQSPLWVQMYLARIGMRPINAVVDVTNYLMMLTGQPLHAFDYDKLIKVSGGEADIHVRAGREGEKLDLLDGRTIELSTDDIVIAAGNTAIGLAGAMGGASTVIDENTQNIIIESATFNLYKLRATQMRHGIFSEAITRFTKGQPAELSAPVLIDAIRLMSEWSGAKCASEIAQIYPVKQEKNVLEFEADIINSILGSKFSNQEIAVTLQNVEFGVDQISEGMMSVIAPYWRADIRILEDVIEEIGRINGFDNIKPTLPIREFTATKPDNFDNFRSTICKNLARSGANEVLTYSFIHGDVIQKAGQNILNSYRITNSISPDLQYYRQTLTPSLLGLIHPNIKQGYNEFALFEINKTHCKQDGLTDENVPVESEKLALIVTNKEPQKGASYFKAKRMFDYLSEFFGLKLEYREINKSSDDPTTAPFDYRHSANIFDKKTDIRIGVVGEYKRSVSKSFKLPEYVAGFEIDTRAMFNAVMNIENSYRPLSRYPASERDICFKVADNIRYDQIIDAVEQVLNDINLEIVISPLDIYKSDNSDTKNITVRAKIISHDHTLTGDEISNAVNIIIESVIANTDAVVI
jgi:phenylalanyl-tRNA synthetase beta chain